MTHNWWIIPFLELAFLDHTFSTQIGESFLFWNLHFQIIFFPHKLVDHFFFGTCIFGSYFFHTNWWIISLLEVAFLDHTFSTQIGESFLFWNLHSQIIFFPHKLVDHFFFGTCIFGSYFFHTNCRIIFLLELAFWDHFGLTKFQKRNDPPVCVEEM